PLIGAVVAAAVILDPSKPISGLADSKKLSEKKRDALYPEIIDKALAWSLGRAEVEEIDQLNILHASMLAMRRAVLGLKIQPQHVMVDGNRCPDLPYPMTAVVKGDSKVAAIAAASIIAKVTRDREMQQLDVQYPGYGIAGHKGYPTQEHLQALTQLGITPLHRRSFGPVKRILAGEIA
ncbi:MAG: ribonuclease HII, partial [Gammaproteobacteria bacterium]|nr:ribonuclease HII [Gammaproteobacteria bacterium]